MNVRSLSSDIGEDDELVVTDDAAPAAPPAPDEPLGELARLVEELSRQLPGQLSKLTLRRGQDTVEVQWAVAVPPGTPVPAATPVAGPTHTPIPAGQTPTSAPPQPDAPQPDAAPAAAGPSEEHPSNQRALAAPLVGTFYRSPEPGAPPFVSPGDVVQPGQQVAIIEAMKMLVSVTADEAATVVELLVEDGHPVEYGQPLMLLTPVTPG